MEMDGIFHPVEVKLTSRPSGRDARGLRAFVETYPQLHCGTQVIVHGGPDLHQVNEACLAVPVHLI
jgi:hypothetical protein